MTRPVDPEGLAARFISLEVHESTHDRLVWGMRQNRDRAVAGVPEWEKLRELASQIKEHTLTHLDQYLEQFEANATKLGTHVHWARDAEDGRVKAIVVEKNADGTYPDGYSTELITGKIGKRAIWQPDVALRDVRVPLDNRLAGAHS